MVSRAIEGTYPNSTTLSASKPQRPARATLGRGATGDGDEVGFLLAR
jgi:hypothetical protein